MSDLYQIPPNAVVITTTIIIRDSFGKRDATNDFSTSLTVQTISLNEIRETLRVAWEATYEKAIEWETPRRRESCDT